MITKISGKVSETLSSHLIIVELSNGIGYGVYIPQEHIASLLGKNVSLYTYLHVREDGMQLYGFTTKDRYNLFNLFLPINGIGVKMAHMLAHSVNLTDLTSVIEQQDVGYFTKIPGLGKKTASKVLLELSQKFGKDFNFLNEQSSPEQDTLFSALTSLGYTREDIKNVYAQVNTQDEIEQQITTAIQLLSGKSRS